MNNFFLIVLDGVGIGELPDAVKYGDEGSNTLKNMAEQVGGLNLPNMEKFGLGLIDDLKGIAKVKQPLASYGKMKEVSTGKDSTTGHWEMGGLYIDFDFTYYPDGFPEDIMNKFMQLTGCKGYLGNKAASGTEIIKELGDEHLKTGYPIVYTSADSVFQIAAHEEVIPLPELYRICKITREQVFNPPIVMGRIIARPFIGGPGNYTRTTNRKDFSLAPPSDTILNVLQKNKVQTVAIGKINDLFNYSGIDVKEITKTNDQGMNKILEYTSKVSDSFIFTNLVDFDVYFGHRNDPPGFANKLKEFDNWLPSFIEKLDDSDAVLITADHGNDPTTPSTDHSREYVPILFFRKNIPGRDLGIRATFADAAQTAADFFKIENNLKGKSFL